MRKDFLWGGATAANQYEGGYLEGGKGLSINDVETGTSHGRQREIHETVQEGIYYPSHVDADDWGNGTLTRIKKKSYDWYKSVIGQDES